MRIIWALALAACGGTSGEPIEGDVSINYGGDTIDFIVGAVVEDENTPGQMLVQLGTDKIDCDSNLDNLFSFNNPDGTFLFFSVDQEPGTYTDGFISAMRADGGSTHINSSTGSVTIEIVGDRVTGTVDEFSTTDDEVGEITAGGSFDVLKCF
jgi:hypothetical protein